MIKILQGDCRDVLKTLDADSIDSVVTDPPYHLTSIVKRFGAINAAPAKGNDAFVRASKGFMGKVWDGGDVAFQPETWAEVIRVMKPGAHLIAMGGTRTYHRLVCAIEDAGFEIRDSICYLYGSGFPKSHDISKGIDRAAGVEREIMATGDAVKRMIPGADQHTTGTWLKENGRIYTPTETAPATDAARQWAGWGSAIKPAMEICCLARKPLSEKTIVANVLRHGTGALNVDGCRVGTETRTNASAPKAERNGFVKGFVEGTATVKHDHGRWPANVVHDGSDEVLAGFPQTASGMVEQHHRRAGKSQIGTFDIRDRTGEPVQTFGDSGSAARFFKECALSADEKRFHYTSKADKSDRLGSVHPTIKPVSLLKWLVRLITPPGGTVLDCFAGSGTTGMAAMAEGFNAVLIERELEYIADIKRRVAHVEGSDSPLFAQVTK